MTASFSAHFTIIHIYFSLCKSAQLTLREISVGSNICQSDDCHVNDFNDQNISAASFSTLPMIQKSVANMFIFQVQ